MLESIDFGIYKDKVGSCVDNLPIAMAYVPRQKFENLYEATEALKCGTLFRDLNKPFCGKFTERWSK